MPDKTRFPKANSHQAVTLGVVFGLLAAVGYTGANVFLRALTESNPIWVSCVKATPTLVLVVPWLLVLLWRRATVVTTWKDIAAVAAAGLFAHLFGNVAFQWCLGVVGIAIGGPLMVGSLIVGSAVLSRLFLHEPVTARAAVCNVALMVAIGILSWGAGPAAASVMHDPEAQSPLTRLLGVAAACSAGLAYSTLGIVMRRVAQNNMPLSTTLFVAAIMGVLCLFPLSVQTIGWNGILATTEREWILMALAGACNAIAFLSLAKALQLTTVVLVNAVNASQVAMCGVAGVVVFQEPLTGTLVVGAALTVISLLFMKGRKK